MRNRMACMEIQHSIGAKARIKRCPPFTLPPDLPLGTQVTVIATAPGTTIVRDDSGREWQLSRCCVRVGMLYQFGNVGENLRDKGSWPSRP
jgi:hypothetical protein